jgi:hypothetical protein
MEKSEVKIIKDNASTIHISHPTSSYGIFCFNSLGDLFLNSDYGTYAFAWRSYGPGEFKEFLKSLDAEYVFGKFQTNNYVTNQKKISKFTEKHLTVLINEFIRVLREEEVTV